MLEHKRHRVEHEMKLALVELLRLFECGLVPETEAEMELMLKCISDRANDRLNPSVIGRHGRVIPDEQLRWLF